MKSEVRKNSQAGITIVETVIAALLLVIGSLSMVGLIVGAIATNNRNKLESTQTMLATSIAEKINSTIIGSGSSTLKDCAGTTHTIDTESQKGANLSGADIDFTEDIAADSDKDHYHMDYVVRTPCSLAGAMEGTYDVRWNVRLIGDVDGSGNIDASQTKTYLLTIGARLKDHGEGNIFYAKPVTIRVLSGN